MINSIIMVLLIKVLWLSTIFPGDFKNKQISNKILIEFDFQ